LEETRKYKKYGKRNEKIFKENKKNLIMRKDNEREKIIKGSGWGP
jgi:hypothetical protein